MTDFDVWLSNTFTAEGETLLYTKQIPILDSEGKIQTHASGAIKSTWPAFKPDKRSLKKRHPSLYVTSAVYSDDMTPISACRANVKTVALLLLDDVSPTPGPGQYKSGAHLLKPTWIMETSAGNFQHVLAFDLDAQPTQDEYCPMHKALSREGWTDPGAGNPVRNIRLPGSKNLKPSKGGFEARLVEWNKEAIYTPEQILAAYGVVIEDADRVGSTYKGVFHVEDDGGDEVLAWLSDNNYVTSTPHSNGWIDVVCPNAGEHSDGNENGGYHPAHRSYRCLHGHCADISSADFLDWVAAQGGPRATQGVRMELMSAMLNQYLPAVTESMFSLTAETIAARMVVPTEGMFSQYAYIRDDNSFYDMVLGERISRDTFDALYRHVNTLSRHASANGGFPKTTASKYYDERREDRGGAVVKNLTYAPGHPFLMQHADQQYGNLWRDARVMGRPGPVDVWLNHLTRMIPDESERLHVLSWMAFKLQNPGIKINHQWSFGGLPGAGKDRLIEPFLYALGRRNVKITDLIRLTGRFNYDIECEMLVINEARESPSIKDRRHTENSLKPFCAAPPLTLQVEKKGQAPYEVMNLLGMIMLSNYADPIVLDINDRRWFITWSPAPPMTEAERDALDGFYLNGGKEHVAWFLHHYDTGSFNPYQAPGITDAKLTMIETGRSEAESHVLSMINDREQPFNTGAVAAPFTSVASMCSLTAPNGCYINQSVVINALNAAGWKDQGRLRGRNSDGTLCNSTRVFISPWLAGVVPTPVGLLTFLGVLDKEKKVSTQGIMMEALKKAGA